MIVGYIGRMGAGKTYSMVRDAKALIGKVPLYSNMTVPWVQPLETVEDLLRVEGGNVLLDEAPVWFSARDFKNTSLDALAYFRQSRKRGVHLWYTAQSMESIEVELRRLTGVIYQHTRYVDFIFQQAVDADTREKGVWTIYRIKKEIYDLYDSSEIIGDGKRNFNRRGYLHKRIMAGMLDDCWTVDHQEIPDVTHGLSGQPSFRRFYRRAKPEDVYTGAEVFRIDKRSEDQIRASIPPWIAPVSGLPQWSTVPKLLDTTTYQMAEQRADDDTQLEIVDGGPTDFCDRRHMDVRRLILRDSAIEAARQAAGGT